jgi:alkylation response protein AidB-like acyl-CoA dehydrogenase
VDFTLTDEQQMLRDTARALLGRECPPELVRAHMDDPSVADELFDLHLRDWVTLGAGDVVDLCLFLEEAGAVLLPGPYAATSALFVPLLVALGHPDATAAAAGELTGTVAVAGRDGHWRPSGDPERTFVLEADRVDRIAVVTAGTARDEPPSVAVVVDTSEVALRPIATLDSTRRTFAVDVVGPAGDGVLAGAAAPVQPEVLDRVLRIATVALAAELVGTARWLVDTTVAHARAREQFDRPIGSFQAVQHQLVDAAFDHQRAAAAVAYAAMTIDADDDDQVRAAHVAKAAAGTAARHAAKVGLQVHGGIGYTWEHDLHLYLRRAYATDDLLGDAAWHHDRLADLLLGSRRVS